jgi:hypothetical protein
LDKIAILNETAASEIDNLFILIIILSKKVSMIKNG